MCFSHKKWMIWCFSLEVGKVVFGFLCHHNWLVQLFSKKIAYKTKMASPFVVWHSWKQLVSAFFVGKGNESSRESTCHHLPSLAIQQRCWLFTSMISNWVGRRHTKSARKPWTGQAARISPWFTWHQRETNDQTNGNFFDFCLIATQMPPMFFLIPAGHK